MLTHTLETYLDLGGDARRTAALLNVHRTTLYWRLDPTTTLELADVQDIDGVQDEPDQVIAWQPLPHVHWQQHRLITQHGTIGLGHAP